MSPPGFPPYVPSDQVRAGHKIPHLDAAFAVIPSPQFAPTLDYVYSVARFAGVILLICWVFVFLFYLAVCIRCCAKCCRCIFAKCCCGRKRSRSSNENSGLVLDDELVQLSTHGHDERPSFFDALKHKVADHNTFRYRLVVFSSSVLLALLITAACAFKGNADLDDALKSVKDSATIVIAIFTLLVGIATGVLKSVNDIFYQLSPQGHCAGVVSQDTSAQIAASATVIVSAMNDINGLSNPIINALNTFIQRVNEESRPISHAYLGFFLVFLGLALLFVMGAVCKSPCIFRVAILISTLLLLGITLLASVALALITVVSDFCIDPSSTLLSLVPKSSEVYTDLQYFLFCSGVNPFQAPLDTANAAIASINSTTQALITSAGLPSSCSTPLLSDVNKAFNELSGITKAVDCIPIYSLYDSAIQGAFCRGGVNGVYDTMVVCFTTGMLMYIVMCAASIFYNWYLRLERAERDSMDIIPSPSGRSRYDNDTSLGGGGGSGEGMGMHYATSSPGSPGVYPPLSGGGHRGTNTSTSTVPSRLLVTPSAPNKTSNPFDENPQPSSHLFAI